MKLLNKTIAAAMLLSVHSLAWGAPALSGSFVSPSGTQNLSTLGPTDWAHWGSQSSNSFEHKRNGGSQISNYTVINGELGHVANYGGNPFAFGWTDGTTVAVNNGTATGIYIMGANRGFQIAVPATTSTRTFTVFVGAYAAQARMVAHISDGSVADHVDTFSTDGVELRAYTFVFQAALPGAYLIVRYTNTGGTGNVSMQAAALNAPVVAPVPDFTISVAPATRTITAGASAAYAVKSSSIGSFSGEILLHASDLPNGVTASFSPSVIHGAESSTLTITTTALAVSGSIPITLSALSGGLIHTVQAMLNVNAANGDDYSISVLPVTSSVPAGGIASYIVSLTPFNGFASPVSLAMSALAPDSSASFSPITIQSGETSTLSITTTNVTPAGTYSVSVGGAGGGKIRSSEAFLTVGANGPALIGSFTTPSAAQNLSQLGAEDWAFWGLSSPVSFDHKLSGSSQISNYSIVGGAQGEVGNTGGFPANFNWSDGAPTSGAPFANHGVFISGTGKGFRITAPADGRPRSLTVYVGVYATQAQIVARLSDGSSADYADTSFSNTGLATRAYTFQYQAASPGQTLSVSFTNTGAGGSVYLQAATLNDSAASYYVTTNGTSSGDGSLANPWDLATALQAANRVGPGSRIWVGGGVYGNGLTTSSLLISNLQGTAKSPIVVRPMPGQHAVINGGIEDHGSYTWFWGLEIMSSVLARDTSRDAPQGIGSYFGSGSKYINLTVHDTAQGLGLWESSTNTEAYGNLVYYNGYQDSDRGHGHGIYTQNLNGTTSIRENIIFKQFGLGIQAYGSSEAHVRGYQFSGNVVFDNGIISTNAERADDILIAAGSPLANIKLQENYTYQTPGGFIGYSRLSWIFGGGPNEDLVLEGNYFMGGNPPLEIRDWNSVKANGNSFYSGAGAMTLLAAGAGQNPASYSWNNNFYFGSGILNYNGATMSFDGWKQSTGVDANSTFAPGKPTGTSIFVRPNQYEAGRGHIVVYNWDNQPAVVVNVQSILVPGQKYQILDAQNFFGPPVVNGIFDGNPILLPMTQNAVAATVGAVSTPPAHTPSEFGVFVVTLVP